MQNLIASLTKVGLDKHDVSTYISLLEKGPANVSELAARTALHRPTIYKALHSLEKIGLVSIMPKKKSKKYLAESPVKLTRYVTNVEEEIGKVIPDLLALYEKRGEKPEVRFLSGKTGIQTVYNDIIETVPRSGVFYRYSSPKDTQKGNDNLPPAYRERRDAKKLERFVITSEGAAKGKKPRLERSIKTLPKDSGLFDYDITQIIYGDKVAIIDDNTETVIIIENNLIAEFQKKLFKILYSKL